MIETYQKHDNLFENNKPNSIDNIVIFSKNDNWQTEQDYKKVSNEENQIWKHLYSKVINVAIKNGSKEFCKGINRLRLCSESFPNIPQISKKN